MISTPFNKRLHTTWRAGAPAPPAGLVHLCSPSCLSATCARSRFPHVPWCNYHVWLTRADEEREGHNAWTLEGLSREKKKKDDAKKRKTRRITGVCAATWQRSSTAVSLTNTHKRTQTERDGGRQSVGTMRQPHYQDLSRDGLIHQEETLLFCIVVGKEHELLDLPGPSFCCCFVFLFLYPTCFFHPLPLLAH